MKNNIGFHVAILLMVFAIPAVAVNYSEDFSSDPGWTTDQTENYYWNQPTGSYFIHNSNTYPGYFPNRYAGKTLIQPVDSFELRWDIKVTQCDWSAGLYFGVWDSSREVPSQGGEYIFAVIGRADGGHCIAFEVGANGIGDEAGTFPGWSLNEWYTFKIGYDSDTEIAILEVFDRDTGQSIWSTTLTVPGGGFTRDLQFLGSNLGFVGRYGCPGFSCSAVLEAYIDNVVLSIPEPPTIDALVDINPDSINKNSKGQWVTVYITLPAGYDVAKIDANTIAITSLAGASCQPDYHQAVDLSFIPQVGDRDEDGIPDLTVKFNRQELIANLCLDDVAVTVEGKLFTGEKFKGIDHIRVIDRGK